VRAALAETLARAGCVAAIDEADELLACAAVSGADLDSLVGRRLQGEPLAWITGEARFGGVTVAVDPGVYVPRWQSVELARRATARLDARGTAVDLCTGSGAVAAALGAARPGARIVATDSDARAVACARANGVDARLGDLFAPLPRSLHRSVDVVVAVVPYVPSADLGLLPRDTLRHEDTAHYDGGSDGTDVLRRVVAESPDFLRPGGALVVELGGEQAALLEHELAEYGFVDAETWRDDEGDLRGMEVTLA
jgi:release factor glutamine methyltransferase